jgi:hypothetical protein
MVCVVLLVSAVTAVPYTATESTKELFDAEVLAKSLSVGVAPVTTPDGKVAYTVNLGSTDARYQVLNGKSFTVVPEKTAGGFDVAVSSPDATVTELLSGKRAHISSSLSNGMNITDPGALYSDAFFRMVVPEVAGMVASPHARMSWSYFESWWKWWKVGKETVKSAWNDPQLFVKEHLAILIVVIALIVVTVIAQLLSWLFLAPPAVTVPIISRPLTEGVTAAIALSLLHA